MLQEQLKLPSVLVQVCSHLPLLMKHSLTSNTEMDIRKYNILQNYNFVTRTIKSVVIQFIAIVTGAAKISLSIDTSVLTVSIVNQALINV